MNLDKNQQNKSHRAAEQLRRITRNFHKIYIFQSEHIYQKKNTHFAQILRSGCDLRA